MDIYFAGSIRGGRSDTALYADLIDVLENHGTVLTEHVGTDAVEKKEAVAGLTDVDIYEQDLAWLRQADVVVAEVTTPSLGVGYELGRAVAWEKPICCLYRPSSEHDLSAMIRGNDTVDLLEYETVAGVKADLEAFLHRH
ncbi:nucleoside 2-deoxyribosyltransferase [Natronobacterium gregoryi]|uniref:Putative 2'-deoxynucleoside 5'-phosphate N-hydrolase 1 n=2 Tax=Natronobacterium gregoryi TaxID=44930 RepID=L0ALM0_NATGS|nr:nucleoside 2-deoxyribosyltransferase [Natronobacterium gregoryi]AFZ74082.1 nucleoside 2-deoxyribosyltransferase [Natronobacterium gregoryi SP2]ELY70289.1 nucleoside 2-deoxyribosyltransferase [Natronobacterium gregoryi SP2]PLK18095.1 nucleoside 2-deoxyribosyltransferase [Natronobacterium gregoryi SP2]SFJ61730.1 deoxynucleoside 5'-monophosphate N-glycosidase [Natronobacterium gregoryi]